MGTATGKRGGIRLPPQSDSGVRRIEPSMDGTWTVIGTFTHAAGQPARGVARILGGDRAPAAPVLQDTAPTLTVVEGRRIAFGPFVESSPDISARWTRNGEGLPAADTPELTLDEVRFADAGEYQLSVSNGLGVTTSAPLRLIVESAPTHPGSVDLNFKPEPMVPLSTNPLHQATTANLSLIPAGSHLYVLNRTTGFQGFGSHLTTNVARLLANGAVDPGFVMFRGGPPPAKIEAVLPLRDGRIAALIQNPGAASSLIQRALVAVLADGTPDPGFRYDLGEHHRSANPPQIRETPDGRILVAHRAPLGDGGASVRVLRVGSDGQVDPSFQPVPVVTESVRMAFQSGNRLLIAGGSYQPPVPFARVLPDGTRDPAFHPDPLAQADVSALLVDARDRILVTLAPQPLGAGGQPVLLRLLPDGALDPSFNIITDSQPPRIAAFSVALQADGHLIALRVLNGLPSVPLVRYGPDGHPDPTFQFPMEGTLAGFAVTAGDQIVVNGLFEEIDGFPRHGIARLNGHDDHRLEPDLTRSDAVGCRVWTRAGRRYHIEFSPALAPGDWPVVGSLVGDGEPQSVFHRGHRQGFFRLRIERP